MNNSIEFEQGLFGLRAIIKTLWDDSFINILQEKKIMELELNVGKGWKRSDIEFLKNFPQLKSIIILDGGLKSLIPLHYLTEIESMSISTYSKTPVDFNVFPKLVDCGFEWIKGSDSLFEKSNMRKLFINRYNKKDSEVFSNFKNIEELSILNSPLENLQGLSTLIDLKMLRLANLKNISSLKGIENLKQLEELEIHRCKKINSITEILGLHKLKKLLLLDDGEIETLKGIEHLENLEMLMFYESTNILDGDLFPITKLKKLKNISFKNRKHYTHNREDLKP
ncbi:hypothetical protein [Kaistella sp.]|uniref:hypothetical protein n=1 Tax=Kaistella sp. TaxID=2782235 RepID=UPI003C6A5B68